VLKFNYLAHFRNRIYNLETENEGDTLQTLNDTDTVLVKRPGNRVGARLAELENFIGGKLFYQFSDSTRLTAEAEYLIGKDYLLHGVLDSRNVKLGFRSMLYSPSLLQRRFLSNHFNWEKNLKNTLLNEIYGGINLHYKDFKFNPFGAYHVLTNYVYFDENAEPKQELGLVQLFRVGFNLEAQWGRIKTQNTAIYSVRAGANVIRFPAFLANMRIYLEDGFFRRLLQSQIGIELHYKTDYYADAYMPVSKQFHIQDNILVKNYLIADIFFNFRIKNFRAFLKLMHANQFPDNGYITSPIYPGMRRNFVFGINWMFFD
jgi:Putative porin